RRPPHRRAVAADEAGDGRAGVPGPVRRLRPGARRRQDGDQLPRPGLRRLAARRDRAVEHRGLDPPRDLRRALARRNRHRLVPLRGQPGDPAPATGTLRRGAHLPLQQVVLRRGDRLPDLAARPGDRPLRQQRLRALRHRRGDHRRHRGNGRPRRGDRPHLPERHRPHLRPLPRLRRRRPRPLLPDPAVMINPLLWAPLAFGVVGLFLPKKAVGWWATAGALATLAIGVIMAFAFHNGQSGLQDTVNTTWISGLGVNYSLGIDGLNLFLVLLTAVLWIGGIAFAAFREQERPQLFFFLMLAAETATLGSFLSQDLLLFVLFFDLMLVPFYFLFGAWGVDRSAEG